MSNYKKGFIVQGLIAIIALALIGGGAYYAGTKKVDTAKEGNETVEDVKLIEDKDNGDITASLFIISPNGNEIFKADQKIQIKYSVPEGHQATLQLIPEEGNNVYNIAQNLIGVNNSYSLSIPQGYTGKYKIMISLMDNARIYDYSDNYFTITN